MDAEARRGYAERLGEFLAQAEQSQATAILVPEGLGSGPRTRIQVKDVRVAMAQLLPLFDAQEEYEPGVHPGSVVHASAEVDPTAHIGPHCVVGPGAGRIQPSSARVMRTRCRVLLCSPS